MNYPSMSQLERLGGQLELYAQLKTEYGSKDVAAILKEVKKTLTKAVDEIKQLPVDQEMANREPNGLAEIKATGWP